MKFTIKHILLLLGPLLILGILFWLVINYSEPFKRQSSSAIEKGIVFLLTTEKKFDVGIILLIQKLNKICHDERLEELWKIKSAEENSNKKLFFELYNSSCRNQNISELLKEISFFSLLERITIKAMCCKNIDYNEVLKDINEVERDVRYNSIHLLHALSLMKEKGCYGNTLDPLMKELAKELIAAEDKDTKQEDFSIFCNNIAFLDVYCERALFLGYAGFPVKQEWIENILKCQKENGSWADSPHTTVLALGAIIQYTNTCK